jgi:Arc/MetJ-type ribon-helix-helix transcriptional regulator
VVAADTAARYIRNVNIKLPGNQQKWLEEQVAAGRFGSVDDAVAIAVADLMGISDDDLSSDLSWAKPYVDEARAGAAQGEAVSLEDAVADIDAHLATLKR